MGAGVGARRLTGDDGVSEKDAKPVNAYTLAEVRTKLCEEHAILLGLVIGRLRTYGMSEGRIRAVVEAAMRGYEESEAEKALRVKHG